MLEVGERYRTLPLKYSVHWPGPLSQNLASEDTFMQHWSVAVVGLFWFVASFLAKLPVARAAERPAVVELFTSEGCSSCPPAEAYIGELAARPDVLPLAFHVDYWDETGWRDRFELRIATPRQRKYQQVLRLANAYTPQVILDGRGDYVGSSRAAIESALEKPREAVPVTLSIAGGEIHVSLESSELGRGTEVLLVSYLRKAVSPIGRGENAGRTLEEFNIVRSLSTLGRWDGSKHEFLTRLDSLPRDATDVAVLVQASGQGAIIGAAMSPLR